MSLLACCWSLPTYAQSREERIEPSAKQMAKLQQLTPSGVAATVFTKDDDLETVAILDTSKAYSSNGAFTDRVRSDNFVRALINKSTGAIVYQVYQTIRYNGDRRDFSSATYSTPAGPVQVPVQTISSRLMACFGGLCSYEDSVGFIVPEAVLREVAASYRPNASTPWRFRFQSQSAFDWEDRLMPAEIAGLLQAAEQSGYRKLRR